MRTFPKPRIDALTDGIFAFAMTLLVLEIRLPPDLPIKNAADLVAHLRSLWPEYVTYLISFFVLATQWRTTIELRHAGEQVSYAALRWWLVYLFFITGVPFSSSVVGHYGDLPPAVWLYAANMIIVGALSLPLRLMEIAPEHSARARFACQDAVLHADGARLGPDQLGRARLRDVRLHAQHHRRAAHRVVVQTRRRGVGRPDRRHAAVALPRLDRADGAQVQFAGETVAGATQRGGGANMGYSI